MRSFLPSLPACLSSSAGSQLPHQIREQQVLTVIIPFLHALIGSLQVIHFGVVSLLLHLMKELQGPPVIIPLLRALMRALNVITF